MADTSKKLNEIRHSLAHLLAYSTKQLYPGSQNAIGPAIENGFYQDFEIKGSVGEDDLPKIEKKMREVLKIWQGFERREANLDEVMSIFKDNKYKQELAREFAKDGKTLTVYTSGDFIDLCKGGHVENVKDIDPKAFKLVKTAGAYWRGDEKNIMLTRIYGIAFEAEKDLQQYLKGLEEAKKRDHRKLGQELGIFMSSDIVGAGLPLLLPKGETIKHTLIEYMRDKEEAAGYQYVSTPVLAHEELYKRSGHAQFYSDDMYRLTDDEGNNFYLKPMNCPHHHIIYEKLVDSYKGLPLRLAEASGLYRHELSGTLTGLIRVRGPITQNDAHIYVTPDQLKEEFLKVIAMFDETYLELGIGDYWFRLSLPDFASEKYAGDKIRWEEAGEIIRQALKESGAKFVEAEGEAAFYGPKLDVQIKNVLGKEDTIATVQVDILVPERMKLKYVDGDGKEKTPIIIHRAIIGSFERFMAFLLEQTAGCLPVWLAPEQVRLITVNQEETTVVFANKVSEQAKGMGLRLTVDNSNESVGKKIRDAELSKIPYTVVIGEKEIGSGEVIPRIRKDMEVQGNGKPVTIDEFLKTVAHEAKSHVSKTSLHG